MIIFMSAENICISVSLHVNLRKSTSETGVKLLVFFTFFINFFIKTLISNQEHNLMSDCDFGPFIYVWCENCMSGFSTFVLDLSKSGNILFRLMLN